ncbi:MAG: rod shape-determining protein MreC [Deltaproteobacteria bacterium]|jgi:rod shape-determining protein MreC|nr:rod shape-determining protein MreC [Deltaproteobacteria bacterium]
MGSKSFKTLLPFVLILICLAIISLAVWNPNRRSKVDVVSLEVAGPLAYITSFFGGGVERIWREYFNLVGLQEENVRLKMSLARQTRWVVQMNEERLENERLRILLGYQRQSRYKFQIAKVLAWDPGPFFQSLVINIGSIDGVLPEAAILTEQGIVGRVAELAPHFAKVLLITDLASGVDAFVERNRVNALLVGAGPGRLSLDYVRKSEDVRIGDLAVSSGLDGIFPAGIPLGTVTFVDKMSMGFFMRAELTPSVELGKVEEVLVLMEPVSPLDWLSLAPDIRALYEKKGNK